jgi:hypothetical protein
MPHQLPDMSQDRLAAAAGTITQPRQAILQEPLDPLPHVLLRQVDQPRDLDQRQPVGDREDRATPSGQAQRGVHEPKTLFQFGPFQWS